ncbi:hypothetical protein ACVW0I_006514 [Bradyrhizobium sp. LM6.11]
MNRRNILWSAVSAVGAALGASRAQAATEASTGSKLKVVYHLSDAEKVNFVLGNIQNHIDGVGGPDQVTIALVIHGPALKAFHGAQANPDISKRVSEFLQGRRRARRVRQHDEGAERHAYGSLAGLRQRGKRRRGPPGRASVAGLSLSAAVSRLPRKR